MVKFSLDHGLLIVGPWLRYRWTMVQRLDIISQIHTSSLYLDYFPFVLGINAVIVSVIYTILIRKWLVLNAHSLFLYSIVYQHHNGFKTFKESILAACKRLRDTILCGLIEDLLVYKTGFSSLLVQDIIVSLSFLVFCRLSSDLINGLSKMHV